MASEQNFGEELLHQIKEKNIQPKPRWEFLAKNYAIWILGGLSLILGAISMSLVFYMIRYSDLDVYRRIGGFSWGNIMLIIPVFWIICLALFIFIVLCDVKHTKTGYRYSWISILFAAILASVALGGFFYALGINKAIDDTLGRHLPFYDRIVNPHIDFWSQPQGGRLTGLIIEQVDTDEYRLIDKDRQEWIVLTSEATQDPEAKLEINRPARFLGEAQDDYKFKAIEILPTLPPGNVFFDQFNSGHSRPRSCSGQTFAFGQFGIIN